VLSATAKISSPFASVAFNEKTSVGTTWKGRISTLITLNSIDGVTGLSSGWM